jgi:hypothetical protein
MYGSRAALYGSSGEYVFSELFAATAGRKYPAIGAADSANLAYAIRYHSLRRHFGLARTVRLDCQEVLQFLHVSPHAFSLPLQKSSSAADCALRR